MSFLTDAVVSMVSSVSQQGCVTIGTMDARCLDWRQPMRMGQPSSAL